MANERLKYIQAFSCAQRVFELLYPYCDRIHICGSVRRRAEFCGDIELCCQPKKNISTDLFGFDHVTNNLNFKNVVAALGAVIKGNLEGKYVQLKLQKHITFDLFMPTHEDYFRQFAIRTGSADYSHRILANAWRQLGWVGTANGLRKQKDCKKISLGNGRYKWQLLNHSGVRPPAWNSEEDFFDWIKIKWIPPNERYIL